VKRRTVVLTIAGSNSISAHVVEQVYKGRNDRQSLVDMQGPAREMK
jgi:hypothetical protein